jgi:hypothetical protein
MKFVVLGLDSVQPYCENLSSDLQRKILFFRLKIIITINTSVRTLKVKSINNISTKTNNRETMPNNRIYILFVIKGKIEF